MQKISGKKLIYELTLDDLRAKCGDKITFCACVHKIRDMGCFTFVLLRTGRYTIQTIHSDKFCKKSLSDLREGAYVNITGTVTEEPRAPHGYEIALSEFEILSSPYAEYPIHISDKHLGCTLETTMEHRSVALRHPDIRAVFKIAEGVENGFRRFMHSLSFTEIHTPKITKDSAAGGVNVFKLKYFGQNASLAQSPQLYKQACVAFFDRVFEIAPAYRAEKRNSSRHLNEFVRLDFEMAFINDMTDIMQAETAMLRYITEYLKEHYSYELKLLDADMPVIEDIPSVTFFEALDILGKEHNQVDLDPTDEAKLCKYAKEKFNSDFIFVAKFPGAKRPFYAMDSDDDHSLTESFDLLFRGVEISTGGQHIHEYDKQVEKLKRCGIAPDELEVYLDIHKYGMPPHGGAGTGLERLVMKLLDLENIRQASLFPRDLHNLDP